MSSSQSHPIVSFSDKLVELGVAHLYGIQRKIGESDESLLQRIACAKNYTNPGELE